MGYEDRGCEAVMVRGVFMSFVYELQRLRSFQSKDGQVYPSSR